jgi:hypothetical protein
VWGWRVLDADTIPEQLARLIAAKHPNVTVYNFGIEGATVAHELKVLRKFRKVYGIDQVIFYTGGNDVFGRYLDVSGGTKQRFDAVNGLASFEVVKAMARFMQSLTEPSLAHVAEMQDKVRAYVRANNSLRAGLMAADQYCRSNGLRCDFVLQPLLFTRARPVGPEIRNLQNFRRFLIGFDVAAHAMYRDALSAVPANRIHDFSGIFDNVSKPVLVDSAHVNELGNSIVAARIADTVTIGSELEK